MAKNKSKKKKKKQHRVFWFFIKFQIFLMVLVIAGLSYYYFGGYADQVTQLRKEAIELVQSSDRNTFVPARTSQVYDINGVLISETKSEKEAEYVTFEDIPPEFVEAMVSMEDKKFYSHGGIDYKAIFRAVKAIIQDRKLSQGGSTITMQLARNIYLDTEKTWQRKVKEMFIAIELEDRYSKDDIMEFYLNNINFSNGYYGVEAACHGYFNCELNELSLSQIAFLCAIPNRPSYYDPLTNYDNTIARRDLILLSMLEDGKIEQWEYEDAVNETIVLNVRQKDNTIKNNYVDTYVYHCATKALMENEGFEFKYYFDSEDEKEEYSQNYDELYEYCKKKIYTDGYKIYTSIDIEKQALLQQALDNELAGFTDVTEDGVYMMQGAAVCIDNSSGQVVAIVGGRSQDFSSYTLNRAYQSHRQPGSSIKPLIVYAPSFERGYTPDSTIEDYKFEGGPSNSGDVYYGTVTVRFAVEQSLNTVAWQMYDTLTPAVGLEYLKNMNFSAIVSSDYVTATSLGGFTTGVSALEMASAYATLENDGLYRNPGCISLIVDSDENLIYVANKVDTVIYTETAARMMTNVLTSVMTSGTAAGLRLDNGMPCAGKTGTTNDTKDGWFCGFTRYYTTAVWVGYDLPRPVQGLTGSSYPGRIWQAYMNSIHTGLVPMDFLPYADLSPEFKDSLEQDPLRDLEEPVEENPEPEEMPEEELPEEPQEETVPEETPEVAPEDAVE